MPKVLNAKALSSIKYHSLPFEGKWQQSFGRPVSSGIWLVWGKSHNGKTSLIIQLIAYLAQFIRIDFYSLEERDGRSLQEGFEREKIKEAPNRVAVIHTGVTLDYIRTRLSKKQAAQAVVIDSVQYMRLRKGDFEAIKEEFPDVLFIWISHAKGSDPRGSRAEDIYYDADVKIYVKGYRAFPGVRGLGPMPEFDIWPEKSAKYWASGVLKPKIGE